MRCSVVTLEGLSEHGDENVCRVYRNWREYQPQEGMGNGVSVRELRRAAVRCCERAACAGLG